MAARAAERALAVAGLTAADVDAIIVSTCTGYLCPGLSSYVTERLGLATDILALDLVGQGCGAAIPNMRTGEALIASGRAATVLSVEKSVASRLSLGGTAPRTVTREAARWLKALAKERQATGQ